MPRVASPGDVSCGTTSAAMSPPSGTAVCRTPRASPRSSAANQCMTARPLAELTLAPAPPARASRTMSERKSGAYAAPARKAAQAPRPSPSTTRSPKRSAAMPHGSMVRRAPTHSAASSTPIWPSDRPYSSRSVGTSTGSPIPNAEKLVCAMVPAARTAQRYRTPFSGRGVEVAREVLQSAQSPKGLIGGAPVETMTLFVSR